MAREVLELESAYRRIVDGSVGSKEGWKTVAILRRRIDTAAQLPNKPALYAFMRGSEPLYIGASGSSLRRRLIIHLQYSEAVRGGIDRIVYIQPSMTVQRMFSIERELIDLYRPELCKCWRFREAQRNPMTYRGPTQPLGRTMPRASLADAGKVE